MYISLCKVIYLCTKFIREHVRKTTFIAWKAKQIFSKISSVLTS